MSYASGFMLGASIGKAIHGMFCGDGRTTAAVQPSAAAAPVPAFLCVSSVPGRRRYRAAAVVNDPALAELLEDHISGLPGIQYASVNAATGSILICSEQEALLDRLEDFLRSRIFVQPAAPRQNTAQNRTSAYADTLYETVGMINSLIAKKTGYVFDLQSLVSLIFIVRGMRKMIAMNQRPSGPQMLWWAASLMRGK